MRTALSSKLVSVPPVAAHAAAGTEIDRLTTEVDKQKAISQDLQLEFNALRNDPKTVERLAREKLGYAKADETIIRFETNAPVR